MSIVLSRLPGHPSHARALLQDDAPQRSASSGLQALLADQRIALREASRGTAISLGVPKRSVTPPYRLPRSPLCLLERTRPAGTPLTTAGCWGR
ncbi:hypothetical protein NDU88_004888 [Pleurodeles waltl]|uniref:Uncharacterized protein n=1 Tax=Pleurodeles waltl TaxID=8319 RepID=A0AAV7PE52_PLEWA|nr:hypothetical protein NDU88_004888 [Pleurodeles waltl]